VVEFRHGGGGGGGGLNVTRGARERAREQACYFREVQDCGLALDGQRRHVMGPRRHFGGGEGSEPDARLLPRFPDFRDPFAPIALPYAVVHRVLAAFSGPLGPGLNLRARIRGRRRRRRGCFRRGCCLCHC